MIDKKELIKALRCIASGVEHDCKTCNYSITGVLDKRIWYECDGDKMMQDAADMLEELTND